MRAEVHRITRVLCFESESIIRTERELELVVLSTRISESMGHYLNGAFVTRTG